MNTSSIAAAPAVQLQAQVQQLKSRNPQEFQAMLTELTGQLNQTGATGHHGNGRCSGPQSLAGKLFVPAIPPG
jgi:hypothetical protein